MVKTSIQKSKKKIALNEEGGIYLEEMFNLASYHPSVKRINRLYPSVHLKKIKSGIENSERLRKHVVSLYRHAKEIKRKRRVCLKDWQTTVVAILFHDVSKIFAESSELSWNERRILGDKENHSLSIMRLFLAVNDPILAHAVRHNSSDFIYDLSNNNVSVPQLILNLVDKSDISGTRCTISEKYKHIKEKIGENADFDDDSERLACYHLDKILSDTRTLDSYEFVLKKIPEREKIALIQRFDDKYCVPIGKYEDTNSNVKIGKILTKWGFSMLLLNGGEVYHKYGPNHYLIGMPEVFSEKMIPVYCHDKQMIIVEGASKRIHDLRKIFGESKRLILLLRTLAEGMVDKYRLINMQSADEIWVMTGGMKNILEADFAKNELVAPKINILQNGYDPEIFYENEIKRQKGKIVYVGALSNIKGVDVLIESFKKIYKEFPYAKLHLIGDEGIYGRMNVFEKKMCDSPGIITHGVLRDRKIAYHLRTAHFSCLPTKIYETFGKSAMQARVCGAPMIVSNKGALPLHVQSDKEGIIIDNVTVDDMYKAMKAMLKREAVSCSPPQDRYNYWLHTTLDLFSYAVLLNRRSIFKR